jgi:hypothetical protein
MWAKCRPAIDPCSSKAAHDFEEYAPSEQDPPGDIAIQLISGQVGRKDVPYEDPAKERHGKWLDAPVYE